MTGLCKLGIWSNCALLLASSWIVSNASAQIPTDYLSQLPVPTARIAILVNDDQLTPLRGNRHPLASAANDRGEVTANQPMSRILLLLRRSPEQDTTLTSLLAAQQDPSSPLFHKWLTPEQFGEWFGPADQDIETVTGWLSSYGFTGIRVSTGRIAIEFNGSVGQVQSAFHTAIHRYQVSGAMHLANATDPSIPAALAPVVVGPVSLNDFGYHSEAIRGPTLGYAKGQTHPQVVPGANPLFTVPQPYGTPFYAVAPYDFATIYDLLPLWNAGLDGTGQTIAIVGETDINVQDPEQFRAFLGLPINNPVITIAGADPGVQPDETEADLDVEWSGAVARGAQINFVASASTETTQGIDLSALYIIDNNLAPVMSESYGGCELFAGTAGNAFEAAMWQQASAEGITVLVSSGDAGSAECDPTGPGQNLAVHPMAVNALASTPYNVAVGGTDFNQYNSWSTYWSANDDPVTKQSVLGYIPEIPWNDSCASTILDAIYVETPPYGCSESPLVVTHLNTIATGGGPSSCISSNGTDPSTCTGGWPKPLWQTGNGVPFDGVRDIPDVSFFASNGVYNSAYIVCEIDATVSSGCDPTASTQTFLGEGGTSVSTPAMAGVMAIINQKYGRQGNANSTLYRLAASAAGASIFHDITTDGNRVACTSADSDCMLPPPRSPLPFGETPLHDSTVGYDMVTGLGSIDIANLVNNWNTVAFASTSTTLTLNGGTATISAVHGATIQALATVTTASGNPSGDVSIFGTQSGSSMLLGTLNAGSVSSPVNSLPGGNYAVTARYAGDSQFAPSQSAPVNVTISAEPSATKISILNYDTTSQTFVPVQSPVPYGSALLIRADVSGQSGRGAATGSVALSDSGNALGQFALNSQSFTETIPTDPILGGTHAFSASFPGDASFNSSVGGNGITVTSARMTCSVTPNTYALRPGWTLRLDAGAALYQKASTPLLGNMIAPTGTMTVFSGSAAVVGPTAGIGFGGGATSGVNSAYTIPSIYLPTEILQISQLTSVTAPLTVTYSGDSNFAPCTSAPLQLTYETGPIASTISGYMMSSDTVTPGTPITINFQVGPTAAPPVYEPFYPAPTGSLQVSVDRVNSDSSLALTTANDVPGPIGYGNYGEATVTIPTANLSVGEHTVSVAYRGDANYLASSGAQWIFFIYIPDFSIYVYPQSLTVTNGQTTSPASVSISTSSGFTGTVSFSCAGLPQAASCVFSPPTVVAGGSTALTITTIQAQNARTPVLSQNSPRKLIGLVRTGGIASAFLIVIFVPRRRRKSVALFIAAIIGIAFGVASCGGGSSGGGSPPPPSATTTNLTATTSTPAKGANDTFTATVYSGSQVPTGTVQFSADGAAAGSPVSLNNGTAQFITSFATVGSHSVTAAYSGDAAHSASISNMLNLTVPYSTGSIPGTYPVTITATSGTLTHNAALTLTVN
jgi:hypothetical protein